MEKSLNHFQNYANMIDIYIFDLMISMIDVLRKLGYRIIFHNHQIYIDNSKLAKQDATSKPSDRKLVDNVFCVADCVSKWPLDSVDGFLDQKSSHILYEI